MINIPRAALLAALALSACSVIDPADINVFEHIVATLDPEDRGRLRDQTREAKTEFDLRSRSPQTRAVRSECRFRPDGGEWEDWKTNVTGETTAGELLDCFLKGHSYADCLAAGVAAVLVETDVSMGEVTSPVSGELQCRAQIEGGFDVADVDGADPNQEVTWGDVMDWLMKSKAPPVGLSAATWQALTPVLCGLTAWGCDGAAGVPGAGIEIRNEGNK